MALDASLLPVLILLVLVSAAVQGFTGFGFGLVGMALATPLVGAKHANVLWTVLALGLVLMMWLSLRRHTQWRLALCLAVGAAVGLPLGLWGLSGGGEDLLCRVVGGTVLVFAGYSLVNPHFEARDISPFWGVPAGVISGFFSGLTAMGGPAAVIFLLLNGLGKNAMKATLAAFFGLNLLCKLLMMGGWTNLVGRSHLVWSALLYAPLVLGMAGGMYGARFVSTRTMRRVVCALLLVPGILLLLG
ncbi:MAG: sulfite exporter TauE/SafE family protein [Candidatus Brocadiaceae bacterium]|jgi:uncharacterized membrane protein YfcA